MYIVIAGCGRVGSRLAVLLSAEGHDVVVIDKNSASFDRLGPSFNGITIEGIAFDEEVLLEARIDEADAFTAVTNFDNTNMMASEVAKSIYDVPTVMSRLYDPDKEHTFFILDIDYVCGTTLLADRLWDKIFQKDELKIQHERLDLDIQIIELEIPSETNGKPAGNLDFGISSRLIALLRDNREIPVNTDTTLRTGDRALINVKKEGWNVVRECLGGSGGDACSRNLLTDMKIVQDFLTGQPSEARIVIGGCSRVGSYLGFLMSMEGHRVTIVDSNTKLFERLPGNYDGNFIEGSVYDEQTLIQAGIEEADAFLALTKFDNTNLMASEVAKKIFSVPYVMARLFNPDKEPTYQALGINYICGTSLVSKALMERIRTPVIKTIDTCFNNLYNIIEFECPAVWNGKTVRYALDKSAVKPAFIERFSMGLMLDDNFVLHTGDTITAIATDKQLMQLDRYLRKQKKE